MKGTKAMSMIARLTERDRQMLEAVQRYHDLKRSAQLMMLVRKEFWRLYPEGTAEVTRNPKETP